MVEAVDFGRYLLESICSALKAAFQPLALKFQQFSFLCKGPFPTFEPVWFFPCLKRQSPEMLAAVSRYPSFVLPFIFLPSVRMLPPWTSMLCLPMSNYHQLWSVDLSSVGVASPASASVKSPGELGCDSMEFAVIVPREKR